MDSVVCSGIVSISWGKRPLFVPQSYLMGWDEFRKNKWLMGYLVVISVSFIDWMLSVSMLCDEVRPPAFSVLVRDAAARPLLAGTLPLRGGLKPGLTPLLLLETQSTETLPAIFPPAKLVSHEKDAEVHQEDVARDRQVPAAVLYCPGGCQTVESLPGASDEFLPPAVAE